MNSAYLNKRFTDLIDRNSIKTVIECGSRDCLDAILLCGYYQPDVIYSFECNPESIVVCKEYLNGFNRIKLIEKAVCNVNGVVDFYATDMERSFDKNIGASSLLVHRGDNKHYVQKKIQVKSTRLDTFMEENSIPKVDLICMDLQGAEYMALEGLGERIKDVRFMILEVLFRTYYHNDRLYKEITAFIQSKGFKMIARDAKLGFGNALYYNNGF